MPKGKRIEARDIEYMSNLDDRDFTIKHSPYGTTHTSKLRYRIVGSRLVPVVEDNVYPQPTTGREYLPESNRVKPIQANLPEKPNHVWPSQVQPPLAQEDPTYRTQSHNDKYYENMSHISKPQNDPLHPYSVLPPVRSESSSYMADDYNGQRTGGDPYGGQRTGGDSYGAQRGGSEVSMQDLVKRLPGGRLPNEPIRFAPQEVSFMMNKMHQDLEGYAPQRLKDIYVEMTTFDRKLSGLIHYDDFVFAARKHQLKCDPALMRLVASMYVVPSTPNFVNYEKVLSFIGAALRSDSSSYSGGPQQQQQQQYDRRQQIDPRSMPHVEPHGDWNQTPRSIGLKTAKADNGRQEDYNRNYDQVDQRAAPQANAQPVPPAHGARSESPVRKGRLEVEGNQAKLLSILHDALKDYSREDFNRLVDAFYLWDREKKGSMTVDDIKTVAYRQNLRVTNSVINALLDMCYVRWDQYDWRKFVKYIEAALPSTAGQDPQPKGQVQNGMTSDNLRDSLNPRGAVQDPANSNKPKASPRSGAASPSSDAARAWFDRFMRLSKALYTVDSKYVGHLPPDDVRWITNEYNRVYELGLYEPDVEEAINVSSTHSGLVNIDSYLRSLSLRGHY